MNEGEVVNHHRYSHSDPNQAHEADFQNEDEDVEDKQSGKRCYKHRNKGHKRTFF